jgi:hypothetical protein
MLLLATPAYAAPVDRGLQGGAHNAGCSACSNDTQSGSEEHPNAEGQTFSSPPSFPWSGGVSGKDTVEGNDQPAQVGTEAGID